LLVLDDPDQVTERYIELVQPVFEDEGFPVTEARIDREDVPGTVDGEAGWGSDFGYTRPRFSVVGDGGMAPLV